MLANSFPSFNNAWFPNSIASLHVTNSSQNIQQQVPFEGPNHIFIGNGQGLKILSSGSSQFCSPTNPNSSLVLHNLLHVPSITKNLISVSKFDRDNHVFFEFYSNFCLVKSHANNEVLLYGNVGRDGLYEFPHLKLQSPASCLVSSYSSFKPSSYPSV